ncbi:MAG: potassium channel protein [Candidatus Nanohaloarchaeota archaeon QJJ-5]|nr:potassium channel protein [Candidatus Nanohaloarchaeota archaeon QJJ-5]
MRESTPKTVKQQLATMKDTAELMIDLAYSAVTYDNKTIAEEVLVLEEYMDDIQQSARQSLMLASRTPEDADQLIGIFNVVAAAEEIADAADDIASIVTDDQPVPDAFRAALIQSKEITVRIPYQGTAMDGKTVTEFEQETGAGTQIIAMKRTDGWVFDPTDDLVLEEEDVLYVRGPKETVEGVYERMTDREFAFEFQASETIDTRFDDIVDTLIEMKNTMELAIGLGYSAALFNNENIATKVLNLETKMDTMRDDVHTEILRQAGAEQDIDTLRSLSTIASCNEIISDAALQIAAAVLREQRLHPVLLEAIQDTDEIITQVEVAHGSDLDGLQIDTLEKDAETGTTVMAIQRADSWQYNPATRTTIDGGDLLIVRVPTAHESQIRAMARQ